MAQDDGMLLCFGLSALQHTPSVDSVSSVVILFRFFTSFVSFSVFPLSFSSFSFPSVDYGFPASLPGLGSLFL
jgi:hypothetical protein